MPDLVRDDPRLFALDEVTRVDRFEPAVRQRLGPTPVVLDGAARDQAAHAVRDERDLAGDDALTSATRSAAMSSMLGCTVVRPLRPKPARS
ncbi:hypothetical protein AB0A71_04580 [Kitasatospora aureofaciens]|uniref:hypothetical protein n=1 Tax=Kitasatospora aureofaciens TaxID=1894 RepID=UPI0033C64895